MITAEQIERTAMAIYIGSAQASLPFGPKLTTWEHLWTAADREVRARCFGQARAALATSELLERVEELEQAIRTAQDHLRDLDHQSVSVAAAEQVLNRAAEKTI